MLENKCKFAAYNWLQISWINTLLLLNSSFTSSILVTSYNLQTLNVLCSFIISIWLIIKVESFAFLYVFYLAFHVCKFNITKMKKKKRASGSLDAPCKMVPRNSFILQYLCHDQFIFFSENENVTFKNIWLLKPFEAPKRNVKIKI